MKLFLYFLAAALSAQKLPDAYSYDYTGDPPFLTEPGWRSLLNGQDLTGWHAASGTSDWYTTKSVRWRRIFAPVALQATAAPGDRIVNGKSGRTANLVTDEKFGDFELWIEFMVGKGGNSGVFLHGLYEIQVFDSYGANAPLTVGDCGGIYGYDGALGGRPPMFNAARPPGEWQSLRIWFQAPRFDAAGKKTENARILRVMLNDFIVQQEFELNRPTQSSTGVQEAATNPIMLQGDHGPVAYRNIYIRPRN
jgi:hypothetical protein